VQELRLLNAHDGFAGPTPDPSTRRLTARDRGTRP
jgi:hypothetical protein